MKRTKSSLIALTIFFSSISLFAQTDSVKCNSQIQFHLVNGYSLSYLNMLSSSTGMRFKVDLALNGSSSNSDQVQNYFSSGSNNPPSDIQKFNNDRSSDSQIINLIANYLWISNIVKEIRLYVGIGPMVSFSRYSNENTQDRSAASYYSASNSFNEQTSSSFGLGLQGTIGLECLVTEKISLLAEFNLDGTYSWVHWKDRNGNQQETLSRTETTEDGNSWGYGLNNLKIGISYNF